MSDGADQARAQYESIIDMLKREADDEIREDPLSVLVRSGWVEPGKKLEAAEYEILLCTGGPAVRIRGELNELHEPETARLEHQDWFKPWTVWPDAQEKVLLTYADYFYYGG